MSADHWLRNSTHPNTTKLSCASKGRSCPHYQHQGWYPCGEQPSRTALGILLRDSTTLYSSIRSFSCWWKTWKHYWKSHEEMFSLYLTFSPAGPHTLPIPMNKESAHRWGSGLAAFCFRPPKRMALHNLLQKPFTGCTKVTRKAETGPGLNSPAAECCVVKGNSSYSRATCKK